MANPQQLFEDFSKLAGGAFSAVQGAGQEFQASIKSHFEHWAREAGLVTRAEWDGLQAMLDKTRQENAALAARVQQLEAAQKTDV